MATMDDVRLARALAHSAAAKQAHAASKECETKGHVFRKQRVWCVRCKGVRNPEFPRRPPTRQKRFRRPMSWR